MTHSFGLSYLDISINQVRQLERICNIHMINVRVISTMKTPAA